MLMLSLSSLLVGIYMYLQVMVAPGGEIPESIKPKIADFFGYVFEDVTEEGMMSIPVSRYSLERRYTW